jgi:hypothetical protein
MHICMIHMYVCTDEISASTAKSAHHTLTIQTNISIHQTILLPLLKGSLGGNSRTAIICAITPCVAHVDQSAGTLRFASRACQVENTATVNEVSMSKAQMGKHVQAIQELQDQLHILRDDDGEDEGGDRQGEYDMQG